MHWFHKYVESFFFWICISYIRLNLLNKHWITNRILFAHCVLSAAALPARPLPSKSIVALKYLSTRRSHHFLAKKLAHRRSSVNFLQQVKMSCSSAPDPLERERNELSLMLSSCQMQAAHCWNLSPSQGGVLAPLKDELAGAHWGHAFLNAASDQARS